MTRSRVLMVALRDRRTPSVPCPPHTQPREASQNVLLNARNTVTTVKLHTPITMETNVWRHAKYPEVTK